MKGKAICDGKPKIVSAWGRIGERMLRVTAAALGTRHPIDRSFAGPHLGAARMPNFLDGSATFISTRLEERLGEK